MRILPKLWLVGSVLLAACSSDSSSPAPAESPASLGSVSARRYVAIGESITSGFADGALYDLGQQQNYPTLLAGQFGKVAGQPSAFNQVLMPAGGGFGGVAGMPPVAFGRISVTNTFVPFTLAASSDPTQPTWRPLGTDGDQARAGNQNFAAPGALMADATRAGLGSPANFTGPLAAQAAFYNRLARNEATSSPVSDAVVADPSLFTLWLGSNDILPYCTGGGVSTPTSVASFTTSLNAALDALLAAPSSPKGIVGTVPDPTNLQGFVTVAWDGLNLTAAQATALTVQYPGLSFVEGRNGYVITTGAGAVRKATAADRLLTAAQGGINAGLGAAGGPLPHPAVLDAAEIAFAQQRIADFNAAIRSAVAARNPPSPTSATRHLAVAELGEVLTRASTTGIVVGSTTLTTAVPFGTLISFDGLHPTPRGQALLANTFIQTLNRDFGAALPELNVLSYRGIFSN